jgi:hypothetical protein
VAVSRSTGLIRLIGHAPGEAGAVPAVAVNADEDCTCDASLLLTPSS